MTHLNVMHLTDTLDAGGAEQMAVNLVNMLPRERYRPHLCTTRREGVLADTVAADVNRIHLGRKWRFDVQALNMLVRYNQRTEIDILHAHGTSVFIAALASRRPPYPAVVWHDHYGRYRFDDRPVWLYRLAVRQIKGIIAVNEPLAAWAQARLGMPQARVRYIPNFVLTPNVDQSDLSLPGTSDSRIVCIANFRPEKDHLTLVRAVVEVARVCPTVHVLLVGAAVEPAYLARVRDEVAQCGLAQHVSILGQRTDVPAILRACAIGVLSSASEGLPLALLEYGSVGLPAVATRVGQCAEVLEDGSVGLLVPPEDSGELAAALISLLRAPERRAQLGAEFRRRVERIYSPAVTLRRVCSFYEEIIHSTVSDQSAEPLVMARD